MDDLEHTDDAPAQHGAGGGRGPALVASLTLAALLIGLVLALAFAGRHVNYGYYSHSVRTAEPEPAVALAAAAIDANAIDTITDEQLRAIASMLGRRAAEGDVEAARFVFEAARLQREATDRKSVV